MEIKKEYLDQIAKRGHLIVISGPTGSGKHTIVREYMKDHANACYCIQATNREPEKDETDGKDYYFLSISEFERMIRTGQMLEYSYTDNVGYGTPKKAVEDARAAGHNVLLIVDPVSAMNIRALVPDAILIFIIPASFEVLRKQLAETGRYTEEEISKNMDMAEEWIACANVFDYILINDEIDKTVRRITQIVHGSRYSRSSMAEFLRTYINSELHAENKVTSGAL